MKLKKWLAGGIVVLSLMMFAGLASAHVTVQPKESKQGSYEVFTVRVPSEKEGVTTKAVKVTVAAGAAVTRVEPKAGWSYEIEKNADDTIASVTWTAEDEGLARTEFTEFRLSGKVADDAKELVWKAYQTYSDNSVVEWVGAPDADYPASVTAIVPGTGEGDGHGGAASAPAAGDSAEKAGDEAASSNVPLILSIVAVVLAALALVAALAKRKNSGS
ncbi:YcnI family protein [Paenibacillus sp. GCM10027626]|uniref:YcnI family copper-binding membrane protein n=1 Tax=Paenibacillus sp. GCM10027626 TaxID=3273411 RepID=UPI003635C5BD